MNQTLAQFLFVALVMLACLGLTLMFVGAISALITAIGNRRWLWVFGMLVFAPLVVLFCIASPKTARWPRTLLLGGIGLIGAAGVATWLLAPSLFPPQ